MDAHCSHYYQRLVKMDWGHQKTAIVEYVLMALVGISALFALSLDIEGQMNLLAWWGAVYLGLSMWIDRRWRHYQKTTQGISDAA